MFNPLFNARIRRLLLRFGAPVAVLAWVVTTIWTAPSAPGIAAPAAMPGALGAVGLRAATRPQAGIHLATRPQVFAPTHPHDVLYDQSNSPGITGVSSQLFEPALNSFDSENADDFTVPDGQRWLITGVDVGGSYANGPGPASSVTVRFYADNSGLPGTLLYSASDLPYTPGPGYGDLSIPLSSSMLLPAGVYWLVVQARLDVGTQGQWYWTDSASLSNNQAVWRNPGGGYPSLCVDWQIHSECNFPYFEPDSLFRLNGNVVPLPTLSPTATVAAPSPTATIAAPSPTATASATRGTPTVTVTGTPPTATATATHTATALATATLTVVPPTMTLTVVPPTITPLPASATATAPTATVTVTATPGLPLPIATAPIGVVTPLPPPACGLAWRAATPPSLALHYNNLSAIAVISPTELWTVGYYDTRGTPTRTLIERWDGSAWYPVTSPNPWPAGNFLTGVAVVSLRDAWAVGYGYNGTDRRTLIEHWDGSAWTVVPSPNGGNFDSILNGVTAVAGGLWAVGDYSATADPTPRKTLILHWTGTAWIQVPSPSSSSGSDTLSAVSALSATDVWATGSTYTDRRRPLLLHWDGIIWTQIPGPAGNGCSSAVAISARTTNDVWAVGSAGVGSFCDQQTAAAFHWDGSHWTSVSTSSLPPTSYFNSVVALAADNVWAAGWYFDSYRVHTLIAHWNGSSWSQLPSYDQLPANSLLAGMAAVSATDLWAVGYSESGNTRALAERYHDPCVVPSPTPSTTPSPTVTPPATATGTATSTATVTPTVTPTWTAPPVTLSATPPATLSRTATATPCTIRFTDVTDPSAYYYQGVYYLACRGVISGYSDGTFRPFNNTTRAQMTKIVTLAFEITLVTPSPAGAFADVDTSSVFYQLIETAAARGIVSGYGCGGINPQTGQNEPCDSTRRPYFRPNNFVTRGQLAKIVIIGAGFPLRNPPTPTFTDVPTGNVFYSFIETAVCRQIISGYNDQTFRPNNSAFRSQIAKIVSLAVASPPASCVP